MSDSDSDDDLLNTVALSTSRKTRAADKDKKRKMDMLRECLESSERQAATISRVSSLKRQDSTIASSTLLDSPPSLRGADTPMRNKRDPLRHGFFAVPADEAIDEGSPASKKRRAAMLEDIRDDTSILLGVRETIVFDASRASVAKNPSSTKPENGPSDTVKFFTSKQDAFDDLLVILDKLEASSDTKAQLSSVVDPLRRVVQARCLEVFLQQERLVDIIQTHNHESLHGELCSWLLNVAQSSGLGDGSLRGLASASLHTLRALIKAGKLPEETTRLSSIDGFLSTLECWVDAVRGLPANNGNGEATVRPRNLRGLASFLSIWMEAAPLFCKEACPDTLSKCLVALTRLGIDDGGASNDNKVNILSVAQKAILVLVDLAASKWKDGEFSSWTKAAAIEICRDLGKLGAGRSGTEDEDDESGWFCYAAVARNLPYLDAFGSARKVNYHACELKVNVALQALETLHGSSLLTEEFTASLFNKEEDKSLVDLSKESLGFRALLAGCVSFSKIDLNSDADFGHCLAVCFCGLVVIESGLAAIQSEAPDAPGKRGAVFGDGAQAAQVCKIFSLLDMYMSPLATVSNQSAVNPYMRRFNYILVLFNAYRRNKMNYLDKKKEGKVQKSLHDYNFGASSRQSISQQG